ncbi:hypothetical protein [Aurantimonas marianensis]|uniref:Uncharacterized protein n=1 Tax=Aurantimonas marianensis TaxID=2920428 RepID=A0A9X2H9U0_9HYPH|nr:hypothetical protein [Aurantimonas marianensis]MCP3056135.1 hypothetical protein [Aurantimonas marianensis]
MPAVRGDFSRRAVGSGAGQYRVGGLLPALAALVVSAAMTVGAMVFGASGPAFAGAWTLEKGAGQAIVTGLYSQADEAFDADGHTAPRPDFQKGAVAVLVEYGLTETFTLLGEGEFGAEREGDLPFARPALSHAGIGGRLRLYEADGFVASGQISARVEDAFGAADAAVDTFGWDAPQIEARALAGYGFRVGDYPAFVDAQAAYRHRVGDGPDEVKLDLTFGVRPWSNILILAQGFATFSAGGGEDVETYAYHKAQLSMVYDVNERWSLQAGGFATLAGTNAIKERGLITALWYRF